MPDKKKMIAEDMMGLSEEDCKFIDDNDPSKGMICQRGKTRMVCRFNGKENPDGSVEGGINCKMDRED